MNVKRKIRLVTVFFITCFSTQGILIAQVNTQLPYIPEIAQSIVYRPSAFPKNYYFIGFPFVNNINQEITNDGLNYLDAHTKTDTGAYLDLPTLFNQLKPQNTLAIDISHDLISLGFRRDKNYFSFNFSEKAPILFRYSDQLINFIFKGNGAYLGESIDFSKCGINASHYWEFGFGMTRQLNEKWSAGIRINRIYGIDNVSTHINKLVVNTDPTSYTLKLESDMVLNKSTAINSNSSIDSIVSSTYKLWNISINNDNSGWGFNFGVSYKLNECWNFGIDALDIGKINWKTTPVNYHMENGSYSFSGVGIDHLLDTNIDSLNYADSLKNSFHPKETYESYSTSLNSQIILNAEYLIAPGTYGTLVLRELFFQKEAIPSLSLMIRKNVGKHFTFDINYARQYGNFNSFGMGMVYQLGVFNFFILSDNLIGTIRPLNDKSIHANFGFNLCWLNGKKIPPKQNIEDKERY